MNYKQEMELWKKTAKFIYENFSYDSFSIIPKAFLVGEPPEDIKKHVGIIRDEVMSNHLAQVLKDFKD